ncbi:hypothetical protein K402DRAFT_445765 [Aulographum hederae CBS 113979]|uniref:VanZ-like domain-containing protein n=1 Tax=Aulographum hederae CBS 113979 TaxID=1176131 RepID=A0A6G1H312_9PEZI|nr:hypothetical protein K402DRAFT_445765 [Aulographum hederae CBS 113979]
MRVRTYPAVGFGVLLLLAGYLGLAPVTLPSWNQSDKVLHFVTFFLLTLCFYWIIETNRRRTLQFTIFGCTLVLGVGSEIAQALLPNGREFDPYDIVANAIGSLAAVGICTWYHKRMIERKRAAKNYTAVPGEDPSDRDVELGEGVGVQESGVVGASLEEEVDNWDENGDDWEEDEPATDTAEQNGAKDEDSKKRND